MSPRARHVASITAWLVAGGGAVLLVRAHSLVAREPVAMALQVIAVLIMVWARVTFGWRSFHAAARPTEGPLVTSGPFKLVRNPIYASAILFCAAGVVDHSSLTNAAFLALVVTGLVVRCLLEETELRAHFEQYASYAARTARLVPFVF